MKQNASRRPCGTAKNTPPDDINAREIESAEIDAVEFAAHTRDAMRDKVMALRQRVRTLLAAFSAETDEQG